MSKELEIISKVNHSTNNSLMIIQYMEKLIKENDMYDMVKGLTVKEEVTIREYLLDNLKIISKHMNTLKQELND